MCRLVTCKWIPNLPCSIVSTGLKKVCSTSDYSCELLGNLLGSGRPFVSKTVKLMHVSNTSAYAIYISRLSRLSPDMIPLWTQKLTFRHCLSQYGCGASSFASDVPKRRGSVGCTVLTVKVATCIEIQAFVFLFRWLPTPLYYK